MPFLSRGTHTDRVVVARDDRLRGVHVAGILGLPVPHLRHQDHGIEAVREAAHQPILTRQLLRRHLIEII